MRLIRFFVGAFKGNYGRLFLSSEVEEDQDFFKGNRENFDRVIGASSFPASG
jgi:hypothetical protein